MARHLPFVVEEMRVSDLDGVMAIEQTAFSAPWPARAYRYEITENEHSTMLVVRAAPARNGWLRRWLTRPEPAAAGMVLGYAGCWHLVDEIHICTIAVHADWQRRGFGELLLVSLLDRGARRHARRATLEVRVSNRAAQGLYSKYGFEVVSRRKRYYADNNEDAYIMATPLFEAQEYQALLRKRRAEVHTRICSVPQGTRDERPSTVDGAPTGKTTGQNALDGVESS